MFFHNDYIMVILENANVWETDDHTTSNFMPDDIRLIDAPKNAELTTRNLTITSLWASFALIFLQKDENAARLCSAEGALRYSFREVAPERWRKRKS